jgi:hypothetical protein
MMADYHITTDWKTILSQFQQIEAILIRHGGIAVNE